MPVKSEHQKLLESMIANAEEDPPAPARTHREQIHRAVMILTRSYTAQWIRTRSVRAGGGGQELSDIHLDDEIAADEMDLWMVQQGSYQNRMGHDRTGRNRTRQKRMIRIGPAQDRAGPTRTEPNQSEPNLAGQSYSEPSRTGPN